MGTESRERTPSAPRPIVKKISSPFAGLVLVASQVAANEQSTTDIAFLSIAPAAAHTETPFKPQEAALNTHTLTNPTKSEEEIRIEALGLLKDLQIEPDKELLKLWLSQGGWPDHLHNEALGVIFCESRNKPWSQSEDELYRGLFGLSKLWFDYSNEDWENWADPVINAKVAYKTYLYDISKNQPAWTQWTCKPKL